jgi:hypothetical protein
LHKKCFERSKCPTPNATKRAVEEDGISYYFLVYEYKDHNGSTWKGTTYTQFSANQYQNLNGEIEIAYHSKAGGERYSINTNYTTYQTAEYKYYEEEALSNKTAAFAMLIVFVVESRKDL